ncbi:MAG: aminotransferase class IV [Bacteroidales bacterium]|nr:aminotransferase class IV [Bacteroidales bacterium]
MDRVIGQKIIKDNVVCDASCFTPEDVFIYEVIKVRNAVPLYADEHFARLVASNYGKFVGCDKETFINNIRILCAQNAILNNNVKILYDYKHLYFIFIKSHYPSEEVHEYGVNVSTALLKRNDPNLKKVNHALRSTADNIMAEKGVFEVLLVLDNGCITEGSRSNVFFLKDETVFTAPDDMVLKGVTRNIVIDGIKKLGLNTVMKPVLLKNIASYDSAFLTGTSIDVLNIRSIDEINYNVSGKVLKSINLLFKR